MASRAVSALRLAISAPARVACSPTRAASSVTLRAVRAAACDYGTDSGTEGRRESAARNETCALSDLEALDAGDLVLLRSDRVPQLRHFAQQLSHGSLQLGTG